MLSLDAFSRAQRVWRPGSARTRWGSFSAPPDPLAAIRGSYSLTADGKGRNAEGRRRKEREGFAFSLIDFWLRACLLDSTLLLSPWYRGAEYCDERVCLCVCMYVCMCVCLSVRGTGRSFQPFRTSTSTDLWQTDRQTDRQTYRVGPQQLIPRWHSGTALRPGGAT